MTVLPFSITSIGDFLRWAPSCKGAPAKGSSAREEPATPSEAETFEELKTQVTSFLKIVSLGVALTLLSLWFIRFNSSPSRDIGFYYHPPIFSKVTKGDGVLACPPILSTRMGLHRGYLTKQSVWDCPPGARPLNKEVVAVEGDTVVLAEKGLFVNGEQIGGPAPKADRLGRSTPPRYGTYVLQKDSFWLSADISCSFDSRYFGPVGKSQLVAKAIPVWTATPDTENTCNR